MNRLWAPPRRLPRPTRRDIYIYPLTTPTVTCEPPSRRIHFIHSSLFDHRVPGTHSFIHSFHSIMFDHRVPGTHSFIHFIRDCLIIEYPVHIQSFIHSFISTLIQAPLSHRQPPMCTGYTMIKQSCINQRVFLQASLSLTTNV